MRAQTRPRGRLDRDFKDGPTCIGESSDISVAPHLRSGAVKGRNVSNGSFSTKMACPCHVRFTLDSDRTADIAGGPFRAISRLPDFADGGSIAALAICCFGSVNIMACRRT